MRRVDTVIIGGGQAGLAMSRCLSHRRIEHVVLERGAVAERWRRERWDSLTLLTPNWMTRLPGFRYDGSDPDGYMRRGEVVALLTRYATVSRAPVVTGVNVTAARWRADRFDVVTEGESWTARQIVVATGHCDRPHVPSAAQGAPTWLHQTVPTAYRAPRNLPPGGVLVVGAAATGMQLADELLRAGRRVVVAVGKHTRMPRLYRGRDVFEWLARTGALRESATAVRDVEASRAQPSLQLVGRATHDSVDLRGLAARGATVVGRFAGFDGHRALFADDLVSSVRASDAKLADLLRRFDRAAGRKPSPAFVPHWPAFADARPRSLDLRAAGITSVLWATGYRRRHEWLPDAVRDPRGEIRHVGGVTPLPGLFVLGLPFQRHRSSSFLDGVGLDAQYLAERIAANLRHTGVAA